MVSAEEVAANAMRRPSQLEATESGMSDTARPTVNEPETATDAADSEAIRKAMTTGSITDHSVMRDGAWPKPTRLTASPATARAPATTALARPLVGDAAGPSLKPNKPT